MKISFHFIGYKYYKDFFFERYDSEKEKSCITYKYLIEMSDTEQDVIMLSLSALPTNLYIFMMCQLQHTGQLLVSDTEAMPMAYQCISGRLDNEWLE
ncbi:hypothetical protein [Vibrio vulnificus]|uniref:hypothetical protein n=1 Tax=Vibrio vulnificus TaxID=672 RepID=UPI0024DF6E55|nr:hypothetical protein [Vibrio vulnificus]MDK2624168.1 hypothetical protein [Vibrio vulnificus]MDK2722158.1 hypothetical protein [Vibrio vulnificus]